MNNLSFGEKLLKFPPAKTLVSSGLKLEGNFKIDFVDIGILGSPDVEVLASVEGPASFHSFDKLSRSWLLVGELLKKCSKKNLLIKADMKLITISYIQ